MSDIVETKPLDTLDGSIEMAARAHIRGEGTGVRRRRDPVAEPRKYRFVSVDDHMCEPPDLYDGRLASRFVDRVPRVERVDGTDFWRYEDELIPLTVGDGRQTWDPSEWDYGNSTFDEFRPGIYNIHSRIHDMDIVGCYASLNFPSMVIGFAGQRFMRMKDGELALACLRAFNDWVYEVWWGSYPDRIIPCQIPWLRDANVAADEIRRNAARGFRSVCFSENPEKLGLPTIRSGYWDPFFQACEETETVLNLHIGSSSGIIKPSTDTPLRALSTLFPVNAMVYCVDWLFSPVPQRFPNIRIALSEGGVGWLPMIIDRFEHVRRCRQSEFGSAISDYDWDPLEILSRNFWFCSLFDPTALADRHRIGVDRIMMELDYPHGDSTWPTTQAYLDSVVGHMPQEDADRLTFRNACTLYQHPEPPLSYLIGR